MGTWGSGLFDNDDAADLLGELYPHDPIRTVETLRQALASEWREKALGAAALVAAALPAGDRLELPPEAVPFLRLHRTLLVPELLVAAQRAAMDALADPKLSQWQDPSVGRRWLEGVRELANVLRSA